MGLRFGLDLGTSSIGWAIFETSQNAQPLRLIDMGVRIFGDGRDPKTGDSLGKARRDPKAARRRRDRTLQRRRYLLTVLEKHGLLPPPGFERDRLIEPADWQGTGNALYTLRSHAASEKISLYQLGRVLWHLSQRRGFKSNRKADSKDEDGGKIALGGQTLRAKMQTEGFSTVGQFLAARQADADPNKRELVRIRLHGEGAKATYDFYPQRHMLEEEFEIIWAEQSRHYTELTEKLRDTLRKVIFFQRPLKPVLPGRCTFFPDEYRIPRSREIAQEFIILAQLGSLRIDAGDGARPLTVEERDKLATPLLSGENVTWKKVRKLLDIGAAARINLGEGGEKALHVNPIPARFLGTKKKPGTLADRWFSLSKDIQTRIIELLDPAPQRDEDPVPIRSDEELAAWAQDALGLDEECAVRFTRTALPDGHLNLSARAVSMILPHLRAPAEDGFVRTYADAAREAGIDHSDLEDGEWYDRLPPYNQVPALQRHIGFGTGNPDDPADVRFGRIPNPTVHIALNQLRRVINALIDRHGTPDEIVVEVARDLKQSRKQKDEAQKRNEANRKANDSRRKELAEAGHISEGERRVRDKLLRMRLWEELGPVNDRRCPYTGEMISLARLMSDDVEIEHILPFARTLDDSPANKTVSLRSANRLKRNLSPAEAAGSHPDTFDLEEMRARARTMPSNKRWRFDPDAMDRFEREERDFMDRQLHATGHLARLSRTYLLKLFPPENDQGQRHSPVWVVTGQLTAKLRRQWGLHLGDHNRKNRDDHRHHAMDAAIIAMIDRSLLQKVATLSGREVERGADVDRLIADLPAPYEGYSVEVRRRAETLLVAPRPDHGQIDPGKPDRTSGKLHEETYYGAVRDIPENQADRARGNVVRRKPVVDLTPKDIGFVRDAWIRGELERVTQNLSGKEYTQALQEWSNGTHKDKKGNLRPNPSRVRVLKPEAVAVPITDKNGHPYKYIVPAENAYMDIVEAPDGSWKGVAVDIYAANTGRGQDWRDIYPDARFIMRLRKGDTVQLFDADGENRVKRVVRLEPSAGRIRLADVNEGGELSKRHAEEDDPFRWDFATISKMKERRARRVRFTPAGRLKTVAHGHP